MDTDLTNRTGPAQMAGQVDLAPSSTLTDDGPSLRVSPPPPLVGGSEGIRRSAWERAIVTAIPAVLFTLALFVWMVLRSEAGTDASGLEMPAMDLQQRVGYWWPFLMGETLGIAALVWSYLSVMVGLLYSTKRPRWLPVSRRGLNDLHRQLSITTILLIVGHVFFVAVGSMNNAMTARIVDFPGALLPFQVSWNKWPYAYGIFAFYLALILGPSYYLRNRLGVRAWKVAHRFTLVVYVLGVVHTMYFDDFTYNGPFRLALWIVQIPVAAALLWRLVVPVGRGGLLLTRRSERPARVRQGRVPFLARVTAGVAAAAVLIGMIVVVATGHIGGEPSPYKNHATNSDKGASNVQIPNTGMNMPGM